MIFLQILRQCLKAGKAIVQDVYPLQVGSTPLC